MEEGKSNEYCSLNFPTIIGISCLLPLCGIFICEMWSIVFAFQESTATECPTSTEIAWNFLPSISEATGRLSPQKYIWRIAIALHVTPRFIIATSYHSIHSRLFAGNGNIKKYRHLSYVAYWLHITEISTLMGLSFISSTEDYEIHKFCFLAFMLSATFHMILLGILHNYGRRALQYNFSEMEQLSLKLKQTLFLVNIIFSIFGLYFFSRHNTYCEDGVYSLFAMCEVIVVVTNIGFHGTAMLDFHNSNFLLQGILAN